MPPPTTWYVARAGGDVVGPVASEVVNRGIHEGKVPLEAYVCAAGTKQWKKLPEVREFSTAYHFALVAKDRTEIDDLTITYNIAIHGPGLPPAEAPTTTAYVLWPSGEVHGPFSRQEIAAWSASGRLAGASLGSGPQGPWDALAPGRAVDRRLGVLVAAGALLLVVGIVIGWAFARM